MARYIIISVLVCIIPSQILEAGQPDISYLLDRYAQTQDKLKSYIVKTERTTFFDRSFTGRNRNLTGKGRTIELCEFRTDGNRAYKNELSWGDEPRGRRPKAEATYKSWLWDGQKYLSGHSSDGDRFIDSVTINWGSDYRSAAESLIHKGDVLNDYEGNERMDSFLRKALERGDKVYVLDRMQKVGRSDCYVIEASIKNDGKYRLWIDPKHGYHIAKSEYRQVGGLSPSDGRYPEGLIIYSSLDVLRFEKSDGVWVPMEAQQEGGRTTRGGDYFKRRMHVKRTEFILNPEHNALDCFVPTDVQNGAEVCVIGIKGIDSHIEYTWQDGKVVDDKGRGVIDADGELLPALAGKALPPLKDIGPDFDLTDYKNKKILLCFWGIREGDSKTYVLELNSKSKQLARKNIQTVLIHVPLGSSSECDDEVKALVRKEKIPFVLLSVKDDSGVESFCSAWALRSLPWLILTDKNHIVTAEGFGLNQLKGVIGDGISGKHRKNNHR